MFEDFEDGAEDDLYPGKTGSGWTVQPVSRSTGFAPPRYRPSPDTTNFIQAPSGPAGDQALGFVGSSAWSLSAQHTISDGLGCYMYTNAAGGGGGSSSSGKVAIAWLDLYGSAGGSVLVDRVGDTLTITETYGDDVDSFDQDRDVVVTDFLPVEGTDDTGLWLEFRFNRTDGWFVKNATTGATIVSDTYPWPIPAVGLEWSLDLLPNAFGPLFPSGSSRVVVDNVYGYPGRDRGSVVRQYPRDDEHGFSGGRRIYPPPRVGRIVGRQG